MSEQHAGQNDDGFLGITLATWIWSLYRAGHHIDDDAIRGACDALRDAPAEADHDALGHDLVAAVRAGHGVDAPTFADVRSAVSRWLGREHVEVGLGDTPDREERVRNIRRYQFARKLPWMCRIVDRFPDGTVGLRWVLVEDVAERVKVMDPYPWDQVDEEYELPLVDFLVRWELAGLESLRFV